MSKHTQGPFVVEHELQETPLDSIPIIGGPEGRIVCEVSADGFTVEETQANAILIAAAPLLLEACQYEYNGGQDDDLLMEIESALLSFAARTVDRKDYYHGLAVKLCAKQQLQAAAIAAALGPVEEAPKVPHD